MRGKAIVNLFFEASTRTKNSFELAGKYLGADVINFQGAGSSVEKGETLYDTALNLRAMGIDLIVVRHQASGVPATLAQYLDIPVVNAGDGFHEHPTQGLLDLLTVREARGRLEGLSVVILGDILHSRVARSDLYGFTTMGATVTLVGPPMLLPPFDEVRATAQLADVLLEADVVQVLRLQKERQSLQDLPSLEEYRLRWGMSTERLARDARPDLLIMHPGPQNRGVEIDSDVADGEASLILNQTANGVAVRMAVLEALLTGGAHDL